MAGRTQEWQEDVTYIYIPDSEVERRLVRKIDQRIVPTVWVLYTLSYLDRANIANAKVGGMEEALQLTSTQYSVILLLFFVSYVLFEVPANMTLTRVRPSIFLSALCVLWGGVAACLAACKSWQALAGVRFALGVVEAGFAPGVAFYLSSWYKRHELAKRYSIYYTATAVSGAFSGLLAGIITDKLRFARGIQGWQWLLLIEGGGSCLAACFTWFILPDWPSTTKWLTLEERLIAVHRLAHDGIGNTQAGDTPSHSESLKMALRDWRTYYLAVMYMLATGSQTIQYFIPTLVGQLGYTGYRKQYMTIPIYTIALMFILVFCFTSDIRRERGNYVTLAALVASVSFIVTAAVNDDHIKYAFLCLAVGGVYAACPLTLLWVFGAIDHPAEKRAVAIAFVNGLGNSASIYGSFLWPAKTGPRYVQGFATTTAFVLTLAIMAQIFKRLLEKYPSKGLNDDVPIDNLDKGSVNASV
ncbi:mfs transporter [Moniliophthora roreri MCA 2997]|uniref:Mfs transporter n=2 Tax=Moniliophthora roreri TaxID=221103 RepID=V2X7L5_MONRO|nr:mfs transporter [Moniliophthora roreri MCA 2997]